MEIALTLVGLLGAAVGAYVGILYVVAKIRWR